MLTKTDIQNAQSGDYSSFFEAVKKTLEEKLENNSFIKNSMNKVEYYQNLTRSLAESKCEEESDCEDDEDEVKDDEDKVKDEVDDDDEVEDEVEDEVKDDEEDEDKVDDDEDDEDDE